MGIRGLRGISAPLYICDPYGLPVNQQLFFIKGNTLASAGLGAGLIQPFKDTMIYGFNELIP